MLLLTQNTAGTGATEPALIDLQYAADQVRFLLTPTCRPRTCSAQTYAMPTSAEPI